MQRVHRRLCIIPFSSYCEQARWCLDWCGIAYREQHVLPVMNVPAVWWAQRTSKAATARSKADRASSPYSVPVLYDNHASPAEYIADSREIMRYADARSGSAIPSLFLHPDEPPANGDFSATGDLPATVDGMVDYFHDTLGPHARRVGYDGVLRNKDALAALLRETGTMPVQSAVLLALFAMFVNGMTAALKLKLPAVARSLVKIDAVFDAVAERLQQPCPDTPTPGDLPPSGRYLAGGWFSAADISFASLAMPVLMVQQEEGFGSPMVPVTAATQELQDTVARLRAHEAGQHAMWLFKHMRQRPTEA